MTARAGAKAGHSDPVVLNGRAIAQRIKGTPGSDKPQPMPLLGGYQQIDNTQDDVIKAMEYAIDEIKKSHDYLNKNDMSFKLISSERQIVAGTNFKLKLGLLENDRCRKRFDVTVFRDLRMNYCVTSYKEVECIEENLDN